MRRPYRQDGKTVPQVALEIVRSHPEGVTAHYLSKNLGCLLKSAYAVIDGLVRNGLARKEYRDGRTRRDFVVTAKHVCYVSPAYGGGCFKCRFEQRKEYYKSEPFPIYGKSGRYMPHADKAKH
jgi:hypothetical protein